MTNDPDRTTRTDPDKPDNPDKGGRLGPGHSGHHPIGVSGMSGVSGCPAVRGGYVVRRDVGGFYLGRRGWVWRPRQAVVFRTEAEAQAAAAPLGPYARVQAR